MALLPFHVRALLRRAASGEALSEAERAAVAALLDTAGATTPADTFSDGLDAGAATEEVAVPDLFAPDAAEDPIEGTRFALRGTIGVGGMGEVLRVFDIRLGREVALKVIHPHLAHSAAIRARFVEEARIQARLQHPNVVPVHEIGVLADGRPWFAMDILRGESLGAVIARVHAASTDTWTNDADEWSLHRLVAAVQQACRAVGYAHGLGIAHRDLKPQNLVVGTFGELRVVDWGLARQGGAAQSASGGLANGLARVSGTPAYMAPELVLAPDDPVDARADVYALGAVLYEVLVGHAPYGSVAHPFGTHAEGVLASVRAGPPVPVSVAARLPVPEELAAIVGRAMSRAAQARYADATGLADAIGEWLDGRRREAVARGMVREAEGTRARAVTLRAEAEALRTEAGRVLASVPKWAEAHEKAAAWAMEDRAIAFEREADRLDARRVQICEAALSHAPSSVEAHAALVAHHRAALADAEERLDAAAADRAALHLRRHVHALPAAHPDRDATLRWLDGASTVSLGGPPTVHATLEPLALVERRLVAGEPRSLGPLPLASVPLAMGSYRVRLRADGADDLLVPVHVARARPWSDEDPRTGRPAAVRLPARGELADDEVCVPAGWFVAGGDARAPGNPLSRRRVWVDSFVVARFPVTHRQYMAFLDALVAAGHPDDALRHAPRLMGAAPGELGALLYGFDGARFSLQAGVEGDRWSLDTPVVLVDWHGAQAYAAWWAARTGQPWRLLDELEWEKAARGVDGRIHPWGDAFDPAWCCMRDSHAGKPKPAEVKGFPADESVYGVRGMGGNVLDWTGTIYRQEGQVPDGGVLVVDPGAEGGRRVTRGGSWNDAGSSTRCATRYNLEPSIRLNFVGFRLARAYA